MTKPIIRIRQKVAKVKPTFPHLINTILSDETLAERLGYSRKFDDVFVAHALCDEGIVFGRGDILAIAEVGAVICQT